MSDTQWALCGRQACEWLAIGAPTPSSRGTPGTLGPAWQFCDPSLPPHSTPSLRPDAPGPPPPPTWRAQACPDHLSVILAYQCVDTRACPRVSFMSAPSTWFRNQACCCRHPRFHPPRPFEESATTLLLRTPTSLVARSQVSAGPRPGPLQPSPPFEAAGMIN